MKAKLRVITMFVVAMMVLVGCSENGNSSSRGDYVSQQEESSDIGQDEASSRFEENSIVTSETNTSQESLNVEITFPYDDSFAFHNDIAWILKWNSYYDNQENCVDTEYYQSAINKKGEILFEFSITDDPTVFATDFMDGYAHIITSSTAYVINTEGDITSSYSIDDNTEVLAYGAGYTFVSKYFSDFDTSQSQYTIYGPDGNDLFSFESQDQPISRVSYCGKDIFQMYTTDTSALVSVLSGATLELQTDVSFFLEDIAAAGFSYFDSGKTGYRSLLHLVNTDLQLTDVPIYPEIGWNWSEAAVSDSLCILSEYLDDTLCVYDIEKNEFRPFNSKYSDQLLFEYVDNHGNPIFQDDRVALPFEGNDGELYVIIYDSYWNRISDPIQTNYYQTISCDRLVVETDDDTIVYDSDGNKVFALSELGYHDGMQPFSEDAARVKSSSDELVFVDLDGNLLFTEVDDSHIKTITLN